MGWWESGYTAWCKKTLPLFEFPALAAAWQTDQPMHSQSANFGKFKLNSLNLAAFFSLHPVFELLFMYEAKDISSFPLARCSSYLTEYEHVFALLVCDPVDGLLGLLHPVH